MEAKNFKRTKIIATIGPASNSPEVISALLKNGVNGVRLNLSHNTHTYHTDVINRVRAAAKKLDRTVAIIADLQGPRIRFGSLPNGGVALKTGDRIKLSHSIKNATADTLPIQHNIAAEIKVGEPIFLRDGQIRGVIKAVRGDVVTVQIQNSGKIMSNHGINLPETHFHSSVITSKDHKDIAFILKQDVDYIALSFVQSPDDIKELKSIIKRAKGDAAVIAKIETQVATRQLEDIIREADAVMVARGDLAIETLPEEVPVIQTKTLHYARHLQTPVIIATQMLESMMNSLQPSRAEVSDIASAVTSEADAVMLSGETAIGKFPIETVAQMKRIILSSEAFGRDTMPSLEVDLSERKDLGIPLAAVTLARQLEAKVILAETLSGTTARSVSSFRPLQPIMMASPILRVCNQMAIVWGSKPFLVKNHDEASGFVLGILKRRGSVKAGDLVVTAFGKVRGVSGGTDTVRVLEVS